MKKVLFYDCEIKNLIFDGDYDPKYQYCDGWHDFEGMGISCIGSYSWHGWKYYLEEDLKEFQKLAKEANEIVGFNSISFDDKLMDANDVQVKTTYDLLCEVRIASGQPSFYIRGLTRGGYSLERLSQANLGRGKSGSGELAPKLWQEGKKQEVIEYCMNDVKLLTELYEMRSHLIDPTSGEILFLKGGSKLDYWWHMLNKKFINKINFYKLKAVRKFVKSPYADIKSRRRDLY